MKKLINLSMFLLFLLSFSSCNKKEIKEMKESYDQKFDSLKTYYAEFVKGSIPDSFYHSEIPLSVKKSWFDFRYNISIVEKQFHVDPSDLKIMYVCERKRTKEKYESDLNKIRENYSNAVDPILIDYVRNNPSLGSIKLKDFNKAIITSIFFDKTLNSDYSACVTFRIKLDTFDQKFLNSKLDFCVSELRLCQYNEDLTHRKYFKEINESKIRYEDNINYLIKVKNKEIYNLFLRYQRLIND